jgi:hypothetical protein
MRTVFACKGFVVLLQVIRAQLGLLLFALFLA